MTALVNENRGDYELPNAHPWFEPTSFDWLVEAAALGWLAVGALVLAA